MVWASLDHLKPRCQKHPVFECVRYSDHDYGEIFTRFLPRYTQEKLGRSSSTSVCSRSTGQNKHLLVIK